MQGLPQMPSAINDSSRLAITNSATFIASSEGRPVLPAGQAASAQVLASEPLPQGQGHRVQVQLANGEKANLITERRLPEGQQLQLTGRAEGQVEVRVLSQAAIQQTANNLINQAPAIKVQLPQGQTLPLQAGQAARAEVLTSQPAANGQGYTAKIQLSTGQQVNLTSSQPLPAKSEIYLSHTKQGELEIRPLSHEASKALDQVKLPLIALPSTTTAAPTTQTPAPPPASLQSLLASASNQLRQSLGNPTTLQTEGRPVLSSGQAAIGQVKSSEPLQQGQGHRVQVQLSNGQQISLIAEKPMQEGLQLQLMGRSEGQVEVRVLTQPRLQQLATSLLSQTPPIRVQLPQGQTLPLQPGQATRAEVLTSQPAANGQGYTTKLQLGSGQQVNVNSSQPLPANSAVHISKTTQGELEVRPLSRETSQVLDQLKLPLIALPSSTAAAPVTSTPPPPPASLQTLLASASSQLRQALGKATTLQTEGRPVLTQGQMAAGQVRASEALPQGQGHRVQVQLSNGQQLSLISEKPLPEGQQLQLTGRAEGKVEVRALSQPAIQQITANLLSQTPPIRVQLPQGQTLPLQPGQATRAEVLTSQPAVNGQGYTTKLQLSSGQQVNVNSSQPLPANSAVHISKTAQGELDVRPLSRETSQLLDQLKQPLTAVPSSTVAPATSTPPTPPASLQTLLSSAGALLRNALSGPITLQSEGRPALTQGQTATGQVRASEALPQGQGHRVQVQLSNGQQLNLISEKPLPEGQQLQLTGRAEGRVEARPAPQQAAPTPPTAAQQTANHLISQLPVIKIQLPQGQSLPLQAGQATRAEVLTSQPAANGQGYTTKLQLSSGQQVNINSSQPLPAASQVHLSKTAQGELEVRPLTKEASQALDQLKQPLTAVPSSTVAPAASTPPTPPASLQTLLSSAGALLRNALSGPTTLQTEGRSVLAQGQIVMGQVKASEALPQGQGHRIQVQLGNGQQLNLIADKPMPEGQQLQLTGRSESQVEARPAPQASIQQTANHLISQLPAVKVQLPQGQTLPLQSGQATRAEVLTSQPAVNGQGYTTKLQLSSGQQVNVNSSQPLPATSQVHLSKTAQGELEIRTLTKEASQALDQLKLPLTAVPSNIKTVTAHPNTLQTLLASASTQLRFALPRQAPLAQAMQQLIQLVRQITPANGLPAATGTPANAIKGADQPANPAATASATATASNKTLVNLSNQLTAALSLIPQGNTPPSAKSLEQFIPFSGLLLESNMLRGIQTNPAGGDLKLLLQQASGLLREGLANSNNTPPQQQLLKQLAQQVQSAESRIQVLQQSSLQATQAAYDRGQPAQIIQLDLPYSVRGDWFQAQLEIRHWIEEKDAEAALEEMERKTRSWEVQLGFTLANWGKIHTLLRLKGETLKASVWIETETSFKPIKDQAELLAARLRRLGADVDEVACYLGAPPPVAKATNNQQIIDTRI